MRYLVGARHVCLTCLRRRVAATCPVCGDNADVIDVGTESGRRALGTRRAAGLVRRAFGPLDPRAMRPLPRGQQLLWLGTRVALVAGGILIGTRLGPRFAAQPDRLEMLVRVAFGIVGAIASAIGFVCLVAAALVAIVSAGTFVTLAQRAVRRSDPPRDFLSRVFDAIERAFIPRVRIEALASTARGPVIAGTLRAVQGAGPAVVAWLDPTSAVALCDAEVSPFEIELADGQRLAVDVQVGAVESGGALAPVTRETAPLPLPVWADVEHEPNGRRRVLRVGDGVRVTVQGGEHVRELDATPTAHASFRHAPERTVLRGTMDNPLIVRVG